MDSRAGAIRDDVLDSEEPIRGDQASSRIGFRNAFVVRVSHHDYMQGATPSMAIA